MVLVVAAARPQRQPREQLAAERFVAGQLVTNGDGVRARQIAYAFDQVVRWLDPVGEVGKLEPDVVDHDA